MQVSAGHFKLFSITSPIYTHHLPRLSLPLSCRGVHGVLLELLSCRPNLHTAVEVTGGNQLFHVVVDTDTVATRIVEVLTRDRMGRATFMPLNRINPSDVNYPDHGSDAVPMLKLLKFNGKYAPAMKQVSLSYLCFAMPAWGKLS